MSTSSRQNYQLFRESYRKRDLEDSAARDVPAKRQLVGGRGREYMRNYLAWLSPNRSAIAALFMVAIASAGMQTVEPLFMRYIVDKVLLNDALESGARATTLNLVGTAFLAAISLSVALGVLRDYRQRLLNARVTLALRRALFERLLHLPLAKLCDMKTGGILSRLTGDIDSTAGLLQMALISPAISAVRLLVAGGILFVLNFQLALVALAVIPGAILISFTFSRRIRPIYRLIRKDVEHTDGRVGETFSGIRVVRAFGREAREQLNYVNGRNRIVRKELFAHRRELALWTSWGLLVSAVGVVIVWYGGFLYLSGRASIGDIMAFQWYSMLLLNPVWQIVSSFSELQRSLASMERVFDLLGMADEKPDRPDAIDAPPVVRRIDFEDVEFEYLKGRPVLRDVNIVVPGGALVALVGNSGAGKTTLTDLIARFHDATRGRILVNGTAITQFKRRSYRNLLAIVQQDVFLFDGSVRDNIAYSNPTATESEVESAARRANAHEFIVCLPAGYATLVGERGVKLSGGQRQRLAIARAFLKAPQILILDEATSNLDTQSEQLIQESMSALSAGRTTFVVAHRLSTIRDADVILVLENGCIVERGTHDELMAARGPYFEMVKRQSPSE